MTKTCNINSRGKLIRLAGGLLLILVAGGLFVLILLGSVGGPWAWVATVVLLASGVFGVYEGRAGWCAARALGFNTWF